MTSREASNCPQSQPSCLVLSMQLKRATHSNGGSLDEEAEKVEAQLAARGERNARRDHEDDHGQALVGVLDAERP